MKKWIFPGALALAAALAALPLQAAPVASKTVGAVTQKAAPARININTADASALDAGLLGVGPAKAEAIIAWRKQKGPFKSIADLSAVKGFGPALIERNKDRLSLR